MGVDLTPIIIKKIVKLKDLSFKTIAVDANNELYQFLSLIRMKNGMPLMDKNGRVTSHLNGLLFRSTHLIYKYGIKPIFVFDGPPPRLKEAEIEKRREIRERAMREWEVARKVGDYAKAYSKAVMTS
ncbi:MAG: flap structure-specific endonuclease, partial [Nitrososphaerota archaeon]|nr:hypothetical protein [Nitrososphaerales archaeon]MDW8045536.1 flap structure-specific endonuclease [Nitrososphaerota archaeon]